MSKPLATKVSTPLSDNVQCPTALPEFPRASQVAPGVHAPEEIWNEFPHPVLGKVTFKSIALQYCVTP